MLQSIQTHTNEHQVEVHVRYHVRYDSVVLHILLWTTSIGRALITVLWNLALWVLFPILNRPDRHGSWEKAKRPEYHIDDRGVKWREFAFQRLATSINYSRNVHILPAADPKWSTLAPTLHSSEKTGRSAQLECPIAKGSHQEVEEILDHVAGSLEHDVDSEGAAESGRGPVQSGRLLLLEAVLHNEDPDPEEGEEAARKDEAIADTSLDRTINMMYNFSWVRLYVSTLTVSLLESRKMPKRMHARVPVMAERNDASARARTLKYKVRYVDA